MDRFDVVIVGGGIAGASLGAALAGRRSILIVEAEDQCGRHATGRSAAFWHEGYGGAGVVALSRASHAFLAAPPPSFADEGFLTPRGAVHVARDSDRFDIVDGVPVRPLSRAELEERIAGLRPRWVRGLDEPGLADIDVARLHAAFLRIARRDGVTRMNSRVIAAERADGQWQVLMSEGARVTCDVLVNAAGAWADDVAASCGVRRLGITPKRRTMVQLRVGRSGLARLPLIVDAAGGFYFKGVGDRSIWLSPHDEIATDPCDAAPEEIDIAVAIDRFEGVVDWPVERVERSWAGLRSFAPDRLPVFGFDPQAPGFFWCAGQGGFGIQTAPAASMLCKALLLNEDPDAAVASIEARAYSPARFG